MHKFYSLCSSEWLADELMRWTVV